MSTQVLQAPAWPPSIVTSLELLAQAPEHIPHAYELSPCSFIIKTGKGLLNASLSFLRLILHCCP